MLEGLISTLMNRFLGMYIKNFDSKQLNIGIWSGDVRLRNLELKKEALDQMKLPLNVLEGHLGQLTLQIPWSNLKGKPVKVLIEDVYLLAGPRIDQNYDAEEEERRQHVVKLEKLQNAELLQERTSAGMSAEEQQKTQSFAESLTTKILDNLQITVKNIHIRYEDAASTPGHPFALGFTLEEFSAVSTNEDWEPNFIHGNVPVTHKLARLGSLAIYWNTDSKHVSGGSHDEMITAFKDLIATGSSAPGDHQFVLKPVNGVGRIELNKTSNYDKPKIRAQMLFDEIGFVLDDDQYRDLLMMVDLFHFYIRHQQYKKFQPKGVTVKEDPKAWFRFAGNAVLSQIHEKNRKWSWAYFAERRDDRKRYIELFKKQKKQEQLTPEEQGEIDKLEFKLSYEDLRFYRSLARNQLRKERAPVQKQEAPKQKQGWVAWVWGYTAGGDGSSGSDSANPGEGEDTALNDEQRKELYDAIDWDEQKALTDAIDLPRETVKMEVQASLKTGSFTLKRDPHGVNKEILSLLFDTFKSKILQRKDSFYGELSLGGLRLYDGTTAGSLYPQIIRVKNSIPTPEEETNRVQELGDEEEELKDVQEEADPVDPFFQANFEQNPLDDSADTAFTVKMRSMEIIYNPRFIEEIYKFFKPPERHMESIGALMDTASATVEGIRQQTRAGLEFALEEHKTVNAKLDLQAPLIIIPESCTQKSSNCLILDAGHVALTSDLVKREDMKMVQEKQSQQYTAEDYQKLEDLMYDKFKLTLQSTQVLIGPNIEETVAQLHGDPSRKNFHIVDRINIDFLLEVSILPKAPNLTRFRMTGHLPVLQASMSDKKYRSMMKIIDVAIPKFDGDEAKSTTPQKPAEKKEVRTYADIRRGSAFQFSAQEQELLMDEETDDEDGGEDTFEEADSGPDTDLQHQQKTFELRFTVDKLQGSLFRADPEGKNSDKELVNLVAEHFKLDFYIRQYEMAAEVVLKTLNMEDLIDEDPSPEFKKIVTSDGLTKSTDSPLFFVQYIQVNKANPEFMSKYEAIDKHVNVSISTIDVVVTRKTILTLLDFVITTFTNPNPPPPQQHKSLKDPESDSEDSEEEVEEEPLPPPPTEEKIRVKVDLDSIALILNNDGIRLATISLASADLGIFLMGKTMRIGGRLGNFSLIDDINEGALETSPFRQLVSIQGDELADFRYETFDPDAKETYPGYNSSVFLRSGSVKVNFVEEPFRKIIDFAVKFGKMQALFNAARQAAMNNANQIQEQAGNMHFDILLRTPIVVFPRVANPNLPNQHPHAGEGSAEDLAHARDLITAYLGEIYAENRFSPLEDTTEKAPIANKISAGIRKTRLTSEFHFGEEVEELELLDKLDLSFKVTYLEHYEGSNRPDVEVMGEMSDLNAKLTQNQFKFLVDLSRAIPAVFAGEPDEAEVVGELPGDKMEQTLAAAEKKDETPKAAENENVVDLKPELGLSPGVWTTLDLVFKAGDIGLELFACEEDKPIKDLEAASLSRASLNQTNVKLRMRNDSSLESELLIESFTIRDSRRRDTNKFRKVMSSTHQGGSQFMASVTISGGQERNLVALLTIDSPRVVFALDYIFALRDFVMKGLEIENPLQEELEEATMASESDDAVSESVPATPATPSAAPSLRSEMSSNRMIKPGPTGTPSDMSSQTQQQPMSISFRVNIVDAQVILIANPTITNSEAIVLSIEQIMLSQQNSMTLQVDQVGMFLCRMDRFDTNRLRILDDFTMKVSMDNRTLGHQSSIQSIHVDVDPLVLRVSLRDIMLAMQIVNKASEMSGTPKDKDGDKKDDEPAKIKQLAGASTKRRTAGSRSNAGKSTAKKSGVSGRSEKKERKHVSSTMIRREELKAEVDGMRVILIGDEHELPLLDLSVKKFGVRVSNWSTDMDADMSIETFVNIYNFSKSAWEPLIEPWQLGFHMARSQNEKLSIDFYSRKMMEVTITPQTLLLASKTAQFMSQDVDMLTKPRGSEAPFRIQNQTGLPLHVWSARQGDLLNSVAIKLEDGQTAPWRFEEWEKMRENLSPEGNSGLVGVKLEDSDFDSIPEISVNREGEYIYTLKPSQNGVTHRLLCEVKLGTDNVKHITFRSPFLVENRSQIPVELGVLDSTGRNIIRIYKILPGESQPTPIQLTYDSPVVVRPDAGFGYTWSSHRLFWKDLAKRPTRSIACPPEGGNNAPSFFFQMHASQQSPHRSSDYPHMRVRLSAPVEVQNLLPYDFKFRIYDKNTRKEWTNFLRKGGLSPVHVVELSHLLLMSIEMEGTPYQASEFSIVNSNDPEFESERTITVKDRQGLELNLRLHYYEIPESGGAFKVSVFAPYIILNKTGLNMMVKSKRMLQGAMTAAGQVQTGSATSHKALPYMFSYPSDERQNRAVLKVGDSAWSRPQSFEAVGSIADCVIPSQATGRQTEIHVGIQVDEGQGKYKLTKVVTLTPRFMLKSKLSETIQVREPGAGSNNIMTLEPGQLLPLHFLRATNQKQLTLLFPGLNNRWSSPFNISDLGSVHVKMQKHQQRQQLLRVEILAEKATVFIHLSLETKHWPFSMRNESTYQFTFYQADPSDEDAEDRTEFRPLVYKLPPRSIMPYAWDYPAAKRKDLVLQVNGQTRHIPLAEIGNLIPMKIDVQGPDGRWQKKTVDLNVVATGPTQTLVISNYKQSKSSYKATSAPANQGSSRGVQSSDGFEVKEEDSGPTLQVNFRLAGMGVSLIDRRMKEMAYITFRDLEFKFSNSVLYQMYNLIIKWVQIDNQLYGGIFPIVLYPSVVPKTGKEMDVHPSVHASVTFLNDDSYGVKYIKYATFLMQQMTTEIDEDFLYALLDFTKIPGMVSIEEEEGRLCDDALDLPEPSSAHAGQDLYFELLNIQPAQLDLSFLRTDVVNVENKTSTHNPLMFLLNILTMAIGNINDAPIKLNALMVENARVSVPVLIQRLQSHYTQEVLYQVHKILGSADFLGNPVGLFNNISSGVVDIFYEPYQGFITTDRPQELGIGFAKGATMFVKKSVFGVTDSLSKFTGSISKGLTAATLDKQFQDRRRMSRSRNRPKHALYGVTAGANSFVSSFASGVGGLARKPIEGAEREGAFGFIKGIGKGVVGAVTKPAIGVFDLASNVTEGIRNTTTVFDQDGLDRVRLTRYIPADGIVRPYSQREALGQFWLKQLDNGKYFNEEYIAHLELPEQDVVVLITYSRIMLIKSKKLYCEWDVPFKELQTISMERTGIVLVLRGNRQGPFIPTRDESSRKFLFRKIGMAVQNYNHSAAGTGGH
ncbi:hypothetical protein EX30DRAFT_322121 [Ascodesmis nigricans]|uniref:Vacuolar protein sorting-associated protein n=1 Tax=Ascodesmis nigricans TaxID=341454 RepID=A0A4S2MNJ3_9PEZI|nr:hypothetical protein EX30DRAFT_322121 [Ascodesmis nigricans]